MCSYRKLLVHGMLLASLCATNVYGATGSYEPSSNTQDTRQIKFGTKCKLHSASFVSDEPQHAQFQFITRYSFDLFGEYAFNTVVGLQLSLGYSGQGMKKTSSLARKSPKIETYFHYIMLSAIPRFYQGSDQQFCLFIGPRVSWLASARVQLFEGRTKVGGEVDVLGDKVPEEHKPKRVDWGILCGLDYESDAGIIVGLDCNIGITNLFEDESTLIRIMSLGVTLGYNFAKLFN
jgi:Outer membrane protein beta-barrel domain